MSQFPTSQKLGFYLAGRPVQRTGHRPVNKEIGPDRSKFHVPQIPCDDTYVFED